MDSSARKGMKLSLVEVPNVVSVLSWPKKVLLAHILNWKKLDHSLTAVKSTLFEWETGLSETPSSGPAAAAVSTC